MFDMPMIEHCEDQSLKGDGVAHEGPVAASLGLRGIPGVAEAITAGRDILLAEMTGGHVHIAQAPLYAIRIAPQGKNKAERRIYALDEAEREQILEKLADEGVRESAIHIGRFKGLGEMNPGQLWETALNPDTRRLLKVRIEDRDRTYALFNMLMSRKEAEKRCAWMEEKGNEVEADV